MGPGTALTAEFDQLGAVEVMVRGASSSGNLTYNVGTQRWPFTGGFVETLLVPGTADLGVVAGASTYDLGGVTVGAGEALTFEVGAEPLVFHPNGLPALTVWTVTVASFSLTGTGNLTFGEDAGTFAYDVGAVSGYRASPVSGTVQVASTGATFDVNFTAQPANDWETFVHDVVPILPLLVILGVAVAVVVALARHPSRPRSPE